MQKFRELRKFALQNFINLFIFKIKEIFFLKIKEYFLCIYIYIKDKIFIFLFFIFYSDAIVFACYSDPTKICFPAKMGCEILYDVQLLQ